MQALTDRDPMPFGKYKGDAMEDIPATYLDWLMGQEWIDSWPQVVAYIEANRAMIDKELRENES